MASVPNSGSAAPPPPVWDARPPETAVRLRRLLDPRGCRHRRQHRIVDLLADRRAVLSRAAVAAGRSGPGSARCLHRRPHDACRDSGVCGAGLGLFRSPGKLVCAGDPGQEIDGHPRFDRARRPIEPGCSHRSLMADVPADRGLAGRPGSAPWSCCWPSSPAWPSPSPPASRACTTGWRGPSSPGDGSVATGSRPGARLDGGRESPFIPAFAREPHGKIHHAARRRRAAADGQCRHRHDHPQELPEDHQAHRPEGRAVLRDALDGRRPEEGLRARPAGLPERQDHRRRPQLRLRLEPRARAVGAARLRHPLRHLRGFRRHLLQQLLQERHPADQGAQGDHRQADGRCQPRLQRHHRDRSGEAGDQGSRRRHGALRHRPVPQALPAERPRRHRAHHGEEVRRSTTSRRARKRRSPGCTPRRETPRPRRKKTNGVQPHSAGAARRRHRPRSHDRGAQDHRLDGQQARRRFRHQGRRRRRRRDRQAWRAAVRCHHEDGARGRRRAVRLGRRTEVGQCRVRQEARARAAAPAQGDGSLRQPAPGQGVRRADRCQLAQARDRQGPRHHDHPRAD